jgi:hypothetical protein
MNSITLTWEGESKTIQKRQIMDLVEEVEEVLTVASINDALVNMKTAKIAKAYAVMLRFAGFDVDTFEVRNEIFKPGMEFENAGVNALDIIAQIVTPPAFLVERSEESSDEKKSQGKQSKKKAKKKAS